MESFSPFKSVKCSYRGSPNDLYLLQRDIRKILDWERDEMKLYYYSVVINMLKTGMYLVQAGGRLLGEFSGRRVEELFPAVNSSGFAAPSHLPVTPHPG